MESMKKVFTVILAVMMLMTAITVPGIAEKELTDFTYVRTFEQNLTDMLNEAGWTLEDSVWAQAYADELGIRIVSEWTLPTADEYRAKLGITIASGELPDMIRTAGTTSADFALINELMENDMLADMTDVFEEYASDELKAYYADAGDEVWYPVMKDGRKMGIPRLIGAENSSDCFIWLRQDWLDNLGLQPPETMDDLLAIIKAFKDNDPDGNGQDDTIGLYADNTVITSLRGFCNCYHAYPEIWVNDGEGVGYGSVLPAMKTALEKLAELYAGGYLQQEFYTMDNLSAMESIVNGTCGAIFSQQWQGIDRIQACYDNNPDASWVAYLLPSCDDEPVRPQTSLNAGDFMLVTSECEHPEFVIQMLNLFIEKAWLGTQEDYYTYFNSEGIERWCFSPVALEPIGKNYYLNEIPLKEAVETRSQDGLTLPAHFNLYDHAVRWLDNHENEWHGWYNIYGDETASNYKIGHYLDNDLFMFNAYCNAPTESMSLYWNALQTMEQEIITQIITGAKTVDDFDAFVDTWMSSGGADCVEEVNAWYAGIAG